MPFTPVVEEYLEAGYVIERSDNGSSFYVAVSNGERVAHYLHQTHQYVISFASSVEFVEGKEKDVFDFGPESFVIAKYMKSLLEVDFDA